MGRCGCDSGACACVVQGGDNVTVTGTGALETPYIVSTSQASPLVDSHILVQANTGTLSPGNNLFTWNVGVLKLTGTDLSLVDGRIHVATTGIYAVYYQIEATAHNSATPNGYLNMAVIGFGVATGSDLDDWPISTVTPFPLNAGGATTIQVELSEQLYIVAGEGISLLTGYGGTISSVDLNNALVRVRRVV